MWFIIYRNYHVVPWQDWSSAGVDPDFPTKALFFFSFTFCRQFHAWMLGAGIFSLAESQAVLASHCLF